VATPLQLVPREQERLTPLERLELLCDRGSLHLLRTGIRSRRIGDRAVDGDGALAGHGRVDGRPVACFAQDASFLGGSLGSAHADTIVAAAKHAGRARIPLVGFVASGGARMQEGVAALGGYGRIFREHVQLSGRVPQISVVTGVSAGGGAYGPALTDFTVMGPEAALFLTGPGVVREVTGEETDVPGLGGPKVHERNGVCHIAAPTDVDAVYAARDLLGYLPAHAGERPPQVDPLSPAPGRPDAHVPTEARKSYDVRTVVARIVDGGRMLEISPKMARNIFCGFARIDGRPVGVVANQPRYLGGVLDAPAAEKAARFVRTCHLFGLPLVVLVDTPGFMPGVKQEANGIIRHGAKLVHAFAEATVPRVTVILRKAYGGAFIAMNSRDLGADLVLAWPGAELGVMSAAQAVGITHRREIAAAADPVAKRAELAAEYAAEHLNARAAAAEGVVDEVIPPSHTRERIVLALGALATVDRPAPHAGNVPL
jgi:acetyl-CoA carboxylase carboxyltransferase component